jgi:hypothetical protein
MMVEVFRVQPADVAAGHGTEQRITRLLAVDRLARLRLLQQPQAPRTFGFEIVLAPRNERRHRRSPLPQGTLMTRNFTQIVSAESVS